MIYFLHHIISSRLAQERGCSPPWLAPHSLKKGGGGVGCTGPDPASEVLLTAGTALAVEISRCLTVEQVGQLAAFLTVLGDQLAFLALNMPQDTSEQTNGAGCP